MYLSNLTQRVLTSLWSITASEVLFALKLEVSSRFFFKRCLSGLREEDVFKLTLVSTPKQCETILDVPEHTPIDSNTCLYKSPPIVGIIKYLHQQLFHYTVLDVQEQTPLSRVKRTRSP